MSANLTLVVLIGLLAATGVNLLLRRTLIKMLLGVMLFGNAVNLLILITGGRSGAPPIAGAAAPQGPKTDPLAQAMILTAIVISLGVAAFVLALAYRSYRLQTDEDVDDDLEDESVALRAEIEETEPDDEPAKVDVGDTEGQLRT